MTPVDGGWRRLLRIWRRTPAHDVDAELAFHFDERIAELFASGVHPDAARAQATREFGDRARVRDDLVVIDQRVALRRTWRERWQWIGQDLRYVIRSLRRSPGFVVMVVATLALGIGANAALFSLLDRLFLRYPDGIARVEQVVRIVRRDPHLISDGSSGADAFRARFSYPEYRDLRTQLGSQLPLAAFSSGGDGQLGRGNAARTVRETDVLGDYFGVLGVAPILGRVFSGDELRIASPTPVVVLSETLWRGQFRAAPDIIGRAITLDYKSYIVIGVVPAAFRGITADAADIWRPVNNDKMGSGAWYNKTRSMFLQPFARVANVHARALLAHGASVSFARGAFDHDSNATARLLPLTQASDPEENGRQLALATRLAGVATIILLIACANVANLLLARGMQRRREIAVRLALGVRRRRLVLLLASEALLVALIGGAVAVMVAMRGGAALRTMLFPDIHWSVPAVDGRVLWFTLLLAILTGLLSGLVPAIRSSRPDVAAALKVGTHGAGSPRSRLRSGLLAVQAALAVILVTGAGLFVQSLRRVEATPTGYDADRVVSLSARANPDHPERRADIATRLAAIARDARSLPGVDRVALADAPPMEGFSERDFFLPGRDSLPRGPFGTTPFVSYVSPGYFAATGMQLVGGTDFTLADRDSGATSVIVDQAMAHTYWPSKSAIGECMVFDERSGPCSRVVGVVSDAHTMRLLEPSYLHYYVPLMLGGTQVPRNGAVIIRTGRGQGRIVAAALLRRYGPEFADWGTLSIERLSDAYADELRPWRVGASLFTAFGLLALLVAMVGIYSTISYTFSQRTHEIGVRIALGARAAAIARLVVQDGLRVIVVGIVIGLGLSWAAGRLVASMLYQTSPHDPMVLIGVAVALVVVAVAACLVPAWRASRVDPVIALGAE